MECHNVCSTYILQFVNGFPFGIPRQDAGRYKIGMTVFSNSVSSLNGKMFKKSSHFMSYSLWPAFMAGLCRVDWSTTMHYYLSCKHVFTIVLHLLARLARVCLKILNLLFFFGRTRSFYSSYF